MEDGSYLFPWGIPVMWCVAELAFAQSVRNSSVCHFLKFQFHSFSFQFGYTVETCIVMRIMYPLDQNEFFFCLQRGCVLCQSVEMRTNHPISKHAIGLASADHTARHQPIVGMPNKKDYQGPMMCWWQCKDEGKMTPDTIDSDIGWHWHPNNLSIFGPLLKYVYQCVLHHPSRLESFWGSDSGPVASLSASGH